MGEGLQRPRFRSRFSGGFFLTHIDVEVYVKGKILEGLRVDGIRVEEEGALAAVTRGGNAASGGSLHPGRVDPLSGGTERGRKRLKLVAVHGADPQDTVVRKYLSGKAFY